MTGETVNNGGGPPVVRVEERLKTFSFIEGESARDYLDRLGQLFDIGSVEEILPNCYSEVHEKLPQWEFRNHQTAEVDLTVAERQPLEGLELTTSDRLEFSDRHRGRF